MPKIFISHRHHDRAIADVIHKHLLYWGIPEKNVYQSSSVSSGAKIGEPIRAELIEMLSQAQLVILVYTFPDADWSYSMWECGVASDPTEQNTRIVVFQCTEHASKLFDQSVVKIEKDSIGNFVRQLHTQQNFFPGETAFMPNIAPQALEARSKGLFEEVQAVLPDQSLSRWQYFEEMIRAHSIFGDPDTAKRRYDLFMLMPFRPELSPIYEDHVRKIASTLGLSCGRADDFFSANAIIKDIWCGICHASAVIADCTDRNPNVFYEIGISHTLDKKTILIAQSIDDVPFDLRHLRVIEYKYTPRGMVEFEKSLTRAIRAVIGGD